MTYPRQSARTRRFTLGAPRGFQVSPDGGRVVFLRSRDGDDPVTCLWTLDVDSGSEQLIVDPRDLDVPGDADLPPEERARRERAREQAGGIVGFATDRDRRLAAFTVAGRLFVVPITPAAVQGTAGSAPDSSDGSASPPAAGTVPGSAAGREPVIAAGVRVTTPVTAEPVFDPRLDPTGRRVAYVSGGGLRVVGVSVAEPDRALAEPEAPGVTYGLAEFIAAEEMNRMRGYWWSADGAALLVARVDESRVHRWHIADPANPARPATEVAYPAAGTPNAEVGLVLIRIDDTGADAETEADAGTGTGGRAHGEAGGAAAPGRVTVDWDRERYPYLVTAGWRGNGRAYALVQTRDQTAVRLLSIDPATGTTEVTFEDTDPQWVDIVPGVPAHTATGALVRTTDHADTRKLTVAGETVTPDGLQVRSILDVDGDTVLFTASTEPTEVDVWTFGPNGLRRMTEGGGVFSGRRSGGTTVLTGSRLDRHGVETRVLRQGRKEIGIASYAQTPAVDPLVLLLRAGTDELPTAVLLPTGYEPGGGPLPVLMDPYGGPHAQRVLAARRMFCEPQWIADQGFAVVVADGRGTPGRGPAWERAVRGDLAGPVLDDQLAALEAAAERFPLDLGRVAIRGWSFGGYLAALAVLRRPDVFHAAVAGAPVTDWRLYDTHYTERYLGHPDREPSNYETCSLLRIAAKPEIQAAPVRPLLLIHGLADDNVVAAHTLRLSSALLAAGRPHSVLPLSGVTHMTPQEVVAENLLSLQVRFLRDALGVSG
jgi:dipeptidyl-peptidase 4